MTRHPISANGAIGITLDLRELTFMESMGLRAVLMAKKLTDSDGCEFSIIPGRPNVQGLFEVTALLDVLPWTDDAARMTVDGARTPPEARS